MDARLEYAADGRFELYKVSLKFDNPEARMSHDIENRLFVAFVVATVSAIGLLVLWPHGATP